MDVDEAYRHLMQNLGLDIGRFFAEGKDLSLGVGQIYSGVSFPIYDDEAKVFVTAQGPIYVLTHECDIDQSNRRAYNTHVLICPIIDFSSFVTEFQASHSEDQLKSFLSDLASNNVSRLIYIPYLPPRLPYGGLLYFNRITHTYVRVFAEPPAERVCTVTNYGLRYIDIPLTNHLLRPKAEALPL
jgi:hypothetical protein